MTSRTGCCSRITNYTTRKYDLSGVTQWKSDYFQGMPTAYSDTVSTCVCASVGAFAATYSNGSSGIGATLTATSNIRFQCDSYTPALNDSVLYKDDTTPAYNGIYTLTTIGSGSVPWVLTRRSDCNQTSNIVAPMIVSVLHGTTNHGQQFALSTTGTVTVGTTPIVWKNGTFFGTANKIASAQAVDASRVYVGGSQCKDSTGHTWSVVCFDIDTGQKLWDYDIGGDCRKILIDPSGNVVCMVDIGSANYQLTSSPSTCYTQNFIVLSPTGTLVASTSFTQVSSPVRGGATSIRTLDFCINEDGDYHVLGILAASAVAPYNHYAYTHIYEWMSPQTSSPTLREFADPLLPISINRIGGRDYIGGDSGLFTPVYGLPPSSLRRTKSQQACPQATTDYDFRFPDVLYSNSTTVLTNVATIAATGTTQGTAAALTAGKNYLAVTGTAGAGMRLPTGSAGDVVAFDRSVSGGATFVNYYVYPPTGGTLNGNAAITSFKCCLGDLWICVSAGSWWNSHNNNQSTTNYNELCVWAVQSLAIDSSGDARIVRGRATNQEVSITSAGVPVYHHPILNTYPFQQWTCLDSSDNSYSVGFRSSSPASVIARDSTGAFLWGHKHSGACEIIPFNGLINYPSGYCPIQMDPDGTAVIVSGFDDSNGTQGPNSVVNDLNFVSDPG